MRHAAQLQGPAQFSPLRKHDDHGSVVGFEELFDGEDGEQLRLGELLGAVGVRIVRQRPASHLHGRPGQGKSGFGRP